MRVSDAQILAVTPILSSSVSTERTQVYLFRKETVESTIKYGLESWYEKTKFDETYDAEPFYRLVEWNLQGTYLCPHFQFLSFRSRTFKQLPRKVIVKKRETRFSKR